MKINTLRRVDNFDSYLHSCLHAVVFVCTKRWGSSVYMHAMYNTAASQGLACTMAV